MELKVKEITTKSVLTDTGIVTDVHTLAMMGVSRDGGLSAKLVFKSEDPKLISEKVRMVHGTKMDLNLSDMNHTLGVFDTTEQPLMSPAEADAHEARLEAAEAQG